MVPMFFCRNVDSLPFWHILAPRIGPFLGKVMPKNLEDYVCIWSVLRYSLALYIYVYQATMVRSMNEGIVARYMKTATHNMIQNNQTEIKCLCHRCKLKCYIEPYSGQLQSHLLSRDFMGGYTWWISDEDDDNVHGAATGNDEEGHGGDEDFPGHDEGGEDARHGGEDQDVRHDGQDTGQDEEDQDAEHGEEDQDAGADGTPSGSWVQNPYVQAVAEPGIELSRV
jgi:hypothetical protein